MFYSSLDRLCVSSAVCSSFSRAVIFPYSIPFLQSVLCVVISRYIAVQKSKNSGLNIVNRAICRYKSDVQALYIYHTRKCVSKYVFKNSCGLQLYIYRITHDSSTLYLSLTIMIMQASSKWTSAGVVHGCHVARNHNAQGSWFLKYMITLQPRQNGAGFWERDGRHHRRKTRILREKWEG